MHSFFESPFLMPWVGNARTRRRPPGTLTTLISCSRSAATDLASSSAARPQLSTGLHRENSIKNLNSVVNGLLRVAGAYRSGEYAQGTNGRAYIGGRGASFAYHICWRGGHRRLALCLATRTVPLVVAALWNNAARFFKKATHRLPAMASPTLSRVPASVEGIRVLVARE